MYRTNGVLGLAVVLVVCSSSTLEAFVKENFKVAVHARAYEVLQMGNLSWLEPRRGEISRQVQIDKIYLETHRDLILVDKGIVRMARRFCQARGLETAGGITLTVNEKNRFESSFSFQIKPLSFPAFRKQQAERVEEFCRV